MAAKELRPFLPKLPVKKYRLKGKDIRSINILVARAVAEAIKPTLGPWGMDKILVNYTGDFKITNDGATILGGIEIVHPAAKMVVEAAKVQDDEVGDGTKTVVVLAGELLKGGEDLLDRGVHPTVIARGYKLAAERVMEASLAITVEVSKDDEDILRKGAMTVMAGKVSEEYKGYLADLVVRAVKAVAETRGGSLYVDREYIKLEKRVGGGVKDTKLISGLLVDKGRLNPSMPKKVEGARIALLSESIKAKDTRREQKEVPIDMEASIKNRIQLKAFIESEEAKQRNMVDRLVKVGSNVVFTSKSIDDIAQHYLVRRGIFAVSGVKDEDMERLAKATGAKVIPNPDQLIEADLGYAGVVEEISIGGERITSVKDCRNPRSVTILIRGATEQIVDEVERMIEGCLDVVSALVIDKRVVGGGGAFEVEVVKELRKYAKTISGKEQLAVEAFARALESIPKTIAENAGLDPIDVLIKLRMKHAENKFRVGIDVCDNKVKDVFEGVLLNH